MCEQEQVNGDRPSRNAVTSLWATDISLIWEKVEVDGDAQKPQTSSYKTTAKKGFKKKSVISRIKKPIKSLCGILG